MQVHSLELDDFIDTDYSLVSIHTGLEDYKLAYLINTNLKTFFKKSKPDLEINDGGQKASFSIFEYEDEKQFNTWYLISNKFHGKSVRPISNGLFQTINETVNTTSYLVPEKKKMDYLLKIEGDLDTFQLHEIVQQIKSIKHVMTSYAIDITTLKSKDFLIF
jgi:hypothetical protein